LGNAEVGLKLTSFASAPSEPQNTRTRVARSARRVHIAACVRARVAVRPVGVNGSKFHSSERRRGVAPGADDENPHHPGPPTPSRALRVRPVARRRADPTFDSP